LELFIKKRSSEILSREKFARLTEYAFYELKGELALSIRIYVFMLRPHKYFVSKVAPFPRAPPRRFGTATSVTVMKTSLNFGRYV
jgi:hypothetical protein